MPPASSTSVPFRRAGQLRVHSANCLHNISAMANCNTCQQLCPQQALHFTDGQWQTADCTLCGLCVSACPTQVFQVDQPALLARPRQQPITIGCYQDRQLPHGALALHCLQQLTPLALFHLIYQYGHVTLQLPQAQCQQCAHQWFSQGLVQQLEAYQIPATLLTIQISRETPLQEATESPEQPRRNFFRDLLHQSELQSKKAVVRAVEPLVSAVSSSQQTDDTPAVFPQRLPLYALYKKQLLPLVPQQQLPFRSLSCTGCTFCGACTHLCPTEALTITEQEDGARQLLFAPELCLQCNLCQQVCFSHGLQWEDFLTQQQFVTTPTALAHSTSQVCQRCGHDYYLWDSQADSTDEAAQLCPFCRR